MGKTFLIAHTVPGSKQTVPPRRDASNANPGPHTGRFPSHSAGPLPRGDLAGSAAPEVGAIHTSRRAGKGRGPLNSMTRRVEVPRGATGLQTPPGTRGRRPREQQERPTRAQSVGTVSGRRDLHPAHGPPQA